MLIVLTMLTTAGMTVVLPILPFVVLRYVEDQSHLAVWVGVLESVNALCAFLVAPFLGSLSDRYGRRPVIIVAAFGAALGYLLFGIGGSIWMLLLGRIIQGITAGDLPALFAYVADITPPEKRAKRFGLLGALSGIGMMVGPAAGGLLAAIDVDLPVFVTAGIALTIAVLSIVALPESLAPDKRTTRLDIAGLHPVKVLRTAFGRKELRGLLIGFTLVTTSFMFFVNNFSVLALDAAHWNPTQVGLVIASIGIIDIVVQGVLLGLLLPRIGERGVLVAGVTVQAAGLLGLAIVGSLFAAPWLLILGCLLLAAGQGGATAAMDGVLSNSVGEDEQGWLAGTTQSLSSGIGMVAPLLAGALYAGIAHSAPYWLGLAMMVAAAIVLGRVRFASPSKRAKTAEPIQAG
ncbi:MFS transporter [Naasia aerilata]|uniref:Tetracycline resistance MFS efflux pump n=1 Tax=Naasia aerilata TaxID=1162966 RepID=A0ABM8GGX3_9MICO|nr:MFS transporter [Naasia aerilata]BDZ47609.1 tetracycline resistance MFS efflux pump [Naasia aerilata]